ncbi:hypothetical protein EVAR_25800_1 [Eumeta japonica]|uniref:Uncharacterized protein n=1 Tax=Eumeta variegata TaxID=151549 RepID=A0A4C1VWH0_EUMVA|nr:hypothetical protein EVAR_25800_1 [Eumeta japonica]
MLNVGQLNLARSMLATTELPTTAKELYLDEILVQEQYFGVLNLLQSGARASAGVYLANRRRFPGQPANLPEMSASNHRLLIYSIDDTRTSATCMEPVKEPCRFRDRGLDWGRFQSLLHFRMGIMNFNKNMPMCTQRQNIITAPVYECLGFQKSRQVTNFETFGSDASPFTRLKLNGIIRALPDRAPGTDGLSAMIIQHVWYTALAEITEMYARCRRRVELNLGPEVH